MTISSQSQAPFGETGFVLSYFAKIEPFATWLRATSRPGILPSTQPGSVSGLVAPVTGGVTTNPVSSTLPGSPTTLVNPVAQPLPPEWTNAVSLELFTSRPIGRGLFKGSYELLLEFSAIREIVIELPQPKGTAALFGQPVQQDGVPDRMRLRAILEPKYGRLSMLEISGAVRFRLPRGLVRPVVEANGRWIDSPVHNVVVPLGQSILRLVPGSPPRLTSPLAAPSLFVRLGQSEIVVKLGEVSLSGTAALPTIRFSKIQLAYLKN